MNISELEINLKRIKKEHGDIEVVINDADTGWLFKIKKNDLLVILDKNGNRLEIGIDYDGERF